MKNPANNPMHPGNCHFHVDDLPFAPGGGEAMAPEAFPDDLTRFRDSEAVQDQLLNDALAIGHAPSIAAALGLVARVRGMSGVAAATGIKRRQRYRALGADGNPTQGTPTRVIDAPGYRLIAERAPAERRQNGKNSKFGVQPHATGIFVEIAARPRGNSDQPPPRYSR